MIKLNYFYNKYFTKGLFPYLWTGIILLIFVILSNIFTFSIITSRLFFIILVTLVLITVNLLYFFRKLSYSKIVAAIFIIGLLVRLAYIINTPANIRQHDVFDTNGHFDYIKTIAYNFSLPATNNWQFYHPPLHYIISAIFIRTNMLFGISDDATLAQNLQYLTCFYSCCMMIVVWRILNLTPLSNKACILVFMIFSLHPTFYLLAGSLNNDTLAYFLYFISLLYLYKWYNSLNIKHLIILSLSFGFAMMTKTSAILLSPVIAFIFIYKFIEIIKEKKSILKYFTHSTIFFITAIPLSLWYPIRNYILFSQSFGYVPKLSETVAIYTGNVPITQRFSLIDFNSFINSTFCVVKDDYNIPAYLIKSSIFGEYMLKNIDFLAASLLVLNVVLIFISIVSMIYVLIFTHSQKTFLIRYSVFILWFSSILSYVIFNINFPFACTMDFRYLVTTIFTGAMFIGIAMDHKTNKHIKIFENRNYKVLKTLIYLISIAFCLTGAYAYLYMA